MKKLINKTTQAFRFAAIILSAGIIFTSCKKDSPATDSISDDELAEAVTESVSASSGGMVTQTESSARMAGTTTLTCGASSDTSITGQSAAGAAITYNYSLNFHRSLICTNNMPSQFTANFTGSSAYTALRMSSSDNSNAQFVIAGLQPSDGNYVATANYVRNGTQQSSVRLQRSFSSVITLTATNIVVSKTTQKIVSGSATVNITAQGSGGYSTSRGGTITFLGNGQATLTLENGGSYTIQW